jgi:ribosomal protein L29
MSELDDLKTENANLKAQMAANQQGIHGLLAQVDAHKGELADVRMISMQLRTNLILIQKSNKELAERNQCLENELANIREQKSAEVPPKEAKGK